MIRRKGHGAKKKRRSAAVAWLFRDQGASGRFLISLCSKVFVLPRKINPPD